MSDVDEWNPVLLREKVKAQAQELVEARKLIQLALEELTGKYDGSWDKTVGTLRDYLESPQRKSA